MSEVCLWAEPSDPSEVVQSEECQVSLNLVSQSVDVECMPVYVGKEQHPGKMVKVNVNNVDLDFEVDTGVGVSVISEDTFRQVFPDLLSSPVPINLPTIAGEIVVPGQVEVIVRKSSTDSKSWVLPLVVSLSDLILVATAMSRDD